MTWRNPLYLQDPAVSYAASDDRFIIDTLFTEGVLGVGTGQGLAVQRPAGANMSVYVPPLDAIIKGDDAALQGSYLARMTEAEFATLTAPNTTNPRIDLLVAEVTDTQYKAATTAAPAGAHLRVIAGTPAASPVQPALPATAIPLAAITVPANALSIVNANITDLRTQAGAASLKVGTQVAPMTAAQILALTTPFDGQVVYNTTIGALEAGDASTATFASTRPLGVFFGRGTDGDVTISGTVTLTRDMEYRNLTVPAGATLITNGFRIAATGTVRNAGSILNDGAPGLAGQNSSYSGNPTSKQKAGGAGGGVLTSHRLGSGGYGGNGAVIGYDNINGGGVNPLRAANGGGASASAVYLGGAGGRGGAASYSSPQSTGGTVQTGYTAPGPLVLSSLVDALAMIGLVIGNPATYAFNGGGGGGGGAAETAYDSALPHPSGDTASGSGGGGGGVVVIVAETILNTGLIGARGGAGGASSGAGSGPGGGGGGGVILLFSRRRNATGGTLDVAGGAAGTANGQIAAVAGTAGTALTIGV